MTDYVKQMHIGESLDRLNEKYPDGHWPSWDPDYANIRNFRYTIKLAERKRRQHMDPESQIRRHIREGYTLEQIASELNTSVPRLTYYMHCHSLDRMYQRYRNRIEA